MNSEERDSSLLSLWCGEAMEKGEREEVERWLAESEDHRRYYRELQKDYLRQRWTLRTLLIACREERRYRRVEARRRMVRRTLLSAASVCLLCGVGVGLWWHNRQMPAEPVPVVAAKPAIQPGSAKAKLYLSTGQEILLGKETCSISDQQADIDVSAAGALAYKGTPAGTEEETPVYNRLVVEKGGEYKLELADGSEVWVNSKTELEYPVRFVGNRRVVRLRGEAYFKVQADSLRPFIVEVDGIEVTALGTEFNVNTYTERQVQSVLVKGSIGVGTAGRSVKVSPGHLAVYDSATGQIKMEKVDVRKYIAWKNGDFVFSQDRLEEVMVEIARWYDCEVVFRDNALKDMRLSGDIQRYADVDRLTHYLERTTGARFVVNGKTIFIYAR